MLHFLVLQIVPLFTFSSFFHPSSIRLSSPPSLPRALSYRFSSFSSSSPFPHLFLLTSFISSSFSSFLLPLFLPCLHHHLRLSPTSSCFPSPPHPWPSSLSSFPLLFLLLFLLLALLLLSFCYSIFRKFPLCFSFVTLYTRRFLVGSSASSRGAAPIPPQYSAPLPFSSKL